MASKKKAKAKKTSDPSETGWVDTWCEKYWVELVPFRSLCAGLHPTHGLVCLGRDVHDAMTRSEHLKRSIQENIAFFDVTNMLRKVRPSFHVAPAPDRPMQPYRRNPARDERRVWVHEGKPGDPQPQMQRPDGLPPLTQPIDPFDTDALIDGANAHRFKTPAPAPEVEGPTLHAYAQKNGHKSTDVLMKLLGDGMTGIHINSRLDAETVKRLDEEMPKKPFPSPHVQPPFQPRSSGRGIRYD